MEIWDAYNKDGTLAGIDLVRGEPIPDGLYFMTVEILVRHVDGDYLLMRRSPEKPAFAGYLEATAGGAGQKGESPIEAAHRELREETGIVTTELIHIATMPYMRMLNHQYLCITDCKKDSITLQEGETVGYKWVSESEFINFINSGDMIPTQRERFDPYFKSLGYVK